MGDLFGHHLLILIIDFEHKLLVISLNSVVGMNLAVNITIMEYINSLTGFGAVVAINLLLVLLILILLAVLVSQRRARARQRDYKVGHMVTALGKGVVAVGQELNQETPLRSRPALSTSKPPSPSRPKSRKASPRAITEPKRLPAIP